MKKNSVVFIVVGVVCALAVVGVTALVVNKNKAIA